MAGLPPANRDIMPVTRVSRYAPFYARVTTLLNTADARRYLRHEVA